MSGDLPRRILALLALALVFFAPQYAQQVHAQQAPDPFRWMDFHSPKDQDIIVWVTRALQVEKWTSIREIGVQYDAALVVTTNRATPQSEPDADTFTIWSVSLTKHANTPLITGVNLRWSDWVRFADGAPEELPALYDNCHQCAANTYFTAFRYDVRSHAWTTRWVHGGQGAPVWNANPPANVDWTQVYAVMAEGDGHSQLCTWNHFDYGKEKPAQDFLYRYDMDPMTSLDRSVALSGKDADAMEMRLCRGQDAVQNLERGQDSPLCQRIVNPHSDRKPVTTPPANNRGRSMPPGSSRR